MEKSKGVMGDKNGKNKNDKMTSGKWDEESVQGIDAPATTNSLRYNALDRTTPYLNLFLSCPAFIFILHGSSRWTPWHSWGRGYRGSIAMGFTLSIASLLMYRGSKCQVGFHGRFLCYSLLKGVPTSSVHERCALCILYNCHHGRPQRRANERE